MCASEDPAALMIEAWCAPTLVSPAGRPCSVIQLAMRQAAGPVDIGDPYLEDEQWDMEAMVLATIAGQLEDFPGRTCSKAHLLSTKQKVS